MTIRHWRSVFAILVFLILGSTAVAADEDSFTITPESAKAEIIQDLMRDREFELGDIALSDARLFPWPGNDRRAPILWCAHFLEAFRTQTGIVHIEPVAAASRYDDPVFQPWQDRCPALAMNAIRMERDNEILDTDLSLPPRLPNGDVRVKRIFSTHNFKLYEVDIDNDAGNGIETVFYGERFYSYWRAVTRRPDLPMSLPPGDRNWNDILPPERVDSEITDTRAGFVQIDLQQCREASSTNFLVDVSAPLDRPTRQPQANYAGIIRYKGANFVYDLSIDYEIASSDGEPIAYYQLELDTVLPAATKRPSPARQVPICNFDNVGVADFAVQSRPTPRWPFTDQDLPGYEEVRVALGQQRFDRLSLSQQSALIDFAFRNRGWFKPLAEGGFAEPLRQAIDADIAREEWTNTAAVLRAMEPNSVRSAIAIGRFLGKDADFIYHAEEGETLEQAIKMMKYAGTDALHFYLDDAHDTDGRSGRPLRFSLPDDQLWMVPVMGE